jgi:hypothetical protein
MTKVISTNVNTAQEYQDALEKLYLFGELTTTALIASTEVYPASTVINTIGFTASADLGKGDWKQTGLVGQPVSRSPAQLGDNLLNDGLGNQWSLKSYPHNVHMLGAVGNGVINDAPVWEAYLTTYAMFGCNGIKGKVYGVAGDLVLPSRLGMKDAEFFQLTPASQTRTLYSPSNLHCNFENVEVNRGTDKNGGSLANSAGFWIVGGVIRGRDISATGNGFGSGMSFHLFDDLIIYSPVVYDNFAGDSTTAALSDDVFQGFWLNRGEKAQVYALSVKNTTVEWTGQAPTTRFNRGVSVGGTKDFTFHGGIVDTVGQGWDFTGDQHTTRFSVLGAHANNCYSWGFKSANTATFGAYIGCHTYRADLGGFVASAPGAVVANPPEEYTQNIVYTNCTATETGSVGNWAGLATIAGFRTGNTPVYPTYPQGIQWLNCIANSTTAAFGFFNEINRNAAIINNWVEESGCKSFGHTDAAFRGLNCPYLDRRTATDQPIPSGTATVVSWDDSLYDGFNGLTSATVNTIRRDGVYTVKASAEFEGDALGVRSIQLYLNSGGGGPRRTSAPSANGTTVDISHTQRFSEGDTIEVYVQQDSGSTLDIKSGQTTLTVTGETQAGRSV